MSLSRHCLVIESTLMRKFPGFTGSKWQIFKIDPLTVMWLSPAQSINSELICVILSQEKYNRLLSLMSIWAFFLNILCDQILNILDSIQYKHTVIINTHKHVCVHKRQVIAKQWHYTFLWKSRLYIPKLN